MSTDRMPRPSVDTGQSESAPDAKAGPRHDIQGLRAFAVLVVIANHLTGWPRGGFVGVDVFFVISGFLITGLLLREHDGEGRISFRGFYVRRFKRIVPASALVIVATVVASFLAFNTVRYEQVKTDAWWALLFSANWRYASEDVDYFNAERLVSPLQHYWSLGIEEQFYFVWPVLMAGIFALLLRGNRSRRTARIAVGVVMGVIVAASFVWAVLLTGDDAHRAYFSTFTRVWELGVGAALAVAAPLCTRIPDWFRLVLGWVGLAGMVSALLLVDGTMAFPAPAAALPVLATALVIAAGTFADPARQQAGLWPLTNRGAVYVGDMSYSLYLWHFPIIIIGISVIGDSVLDKVWFGVAIAAASWYSYVLVERPIHKSRWLLDDKATRRRRRMHKQRRIEVSQSYQYTALSAAGLVAVVLVVVALLPNDAPKSALSGLPDPRPSATAAPEPQQGPRVAALQEQIRASLTDTSWPDDLVVGIDEATEEPIAPDELGACAAVPAAGPGDCAWGPADAKRTAVLVGDSVAISYADVLRSVTLEQGWRFVVRVGTACPFADIAVNEGLETFNPDCPEIRDAAVRDIKALRPDVLFVVNHAWGAPKYPPTEWIAASERELARTGGAVGRVVYVGGPAPAPDPAECFTPASAPEDCTGAPTPAWEDMLETQRLLAEENGGLVVDSEDWFCFQRLCPPYVDDTPVRPDGVHVLPAYTEMIEPVIAEALTRAGVFG